MNQWVSYLIAFLFVSLGFVLAIIGKKRFSIDNSAFFASLIFAPMLAYLILFGRLSEFKGFGIELKLLEAAAAPVEILEVKTSTISPTSQSAKEVIAQSQLKAYFGIGSEVVILRAPKKQEEVGFREVFRVANQLYSSLLQGSLQFFVILDDSDQVLGYFEKDIFLDILRIEIEQVIRGKRNKYETEIAKEQLQQTQLWDIVSFPRLKAESWGLNTTIGAKTSKLDALKTMVQKDLSAIVVTDEGRKYKGIVKREDIVSDLLINLYSLVQK